MLNAAIRNVILAGVIALYSGVTLADQVMNVDGYEIHYSVFNTSFLTPEVAKVYGVVRAKDRALINVAVRKEGNAANVGIKATVKGTVKDLIYRKPLEFFEVREDDAIYYLSEIKFRNDERLFFDIVVQPDPNKGGYTVKFDKTMYTD
jgi:hypothetical protein